MDIKKLHKEIIAAYSDLNLHRITITLIQLYKNEQFGTLEHIVGMISETVEISVDPGLRYFSRLMKLYHPDRGQYHRAEIDRLYKLHNYDGLLQYSHILMLEKIEEIAKTFSGIEDMDYSPIYEWDWNTDGFHIVEYGTSNVIREQRDSEMQSSEQISFYEAFQLRMFGNVTTGFPLYYFEDIEDFELSQSGVNDLNGIQYCIHAKTIGLSGNSISDISYLWELLFLEDLNLSDNKLELIDSLANLQNLRHVNLSDNDISDISPLMRLNKLEYAELSGNRITKAQIRKLEEMGIVVISD